MESMYSLIPVLNLGTTRMRKLHRVHILENFSTGQKTLFDPFYKGEKKMVINQKTPIAPAINVKIEINKSNIFG